jgi:hypothetical protein
MARAARAPLGRILATSWLPLAIGGCSPERGEEFTSCTADERAGIEVTVGDAATGLYLTPIAEVVVHDGGGYTEKLEPSQLMPDSTGENLVPASVAGARERPGTYRVEVSAPGYRPAVRAGVLVQRGECHVGTNRLLIELRKSESPPE